MEVIEKTIQINRPRILNNTKKSSFYDWGLYMAEYVDVLNKQLCELFSEAFDYFCKKENKLVGRESWLGHRESIKPNKTQYIYDFWNMENIEEFSFGFHSTKGEAIGQLIVNIEWI